MMTLMVKNILLIEGYGTHTAVAKATNNKLEFIHVSAYHEKFAPPHEGACHGEKSEYYGDDQKYQESELGGDANYDGFDTGV